MGTITRSFANLITASGPSSVPALGTLTVDNIQFPATQVASANANNLDDYEEGTWTPSWSAGSGSMSYSKQQGFYTKIGRVVHIHCHVITTANNSLSGTVQLNGLPFTNQNSYPAGSMFVENVNIGANITFFAYVEPLQSYIRFRYFANNAGATSVQGSELNAGSDIMFNHTYFV